MSYVAWFSNPNGPFCALTYLKDVKDSFELKRGISRADRFNSAAHFVMDPNHRDRVLADSLYNLDRMVVVSPPLRAFIEQHEPARVEYLTVSILDHDGEVAAADYTLLNPLEVVDCIDKDRSTLSWNAIDPDLITGPEELVFDFDEVGTEELPLIRPRHLPYLVLVRQDLGEAIEGEGFGGIYFAELDELDSLI